MDRTRTYRVASIVVRQRDLGEADRVAVLFTREAGKLSAVAKGVKRARSKLAGAVQLFNHLDALLAAGRTLDVITQVRPLDLFYRLRTDMPRYTSACYVVELLDALVEERAGAPPLFDLLVSVLRGLDGEGDPPTLARGFELRLLTGLGYGPELFTCVSCGTEVEGGRVGFSTAEGGIVCARCRRTMGVGTISPVALQAMRDFVTMPLEELPRRRLSRAAAEELARVLRTFVDYHLPGPLHSTAFLTEVRS